VTSPDPAVILFALLIDFAIGDPRWFPHPVAFTGRVVTNLEKLLRNTFDSHERGDAGRRWREMAAGAVLLLLVTGMVSGISWLLLSAASYLSSFAHFAVATLLSWTTISARSLHAESAVVADALVAGDIGLARQYLSRIVGRDTEMLDEPEIWRALIETVAENSNDGIVAPLFWLTIGGPVAAMAFKAVSTLDSMVGYRNERYIYFGRASARMDDLLNFIPARLTSLLMIAVSVICGFSVSGGIRITLRDRLKHPSPNSAHPEATAAGLLGVRLGGVSSYCGALSLKQYLGDPVLPLDHNAYRRMIRLMYATTVMMAFLSISILYILKGIHGVK